jgi:hypothetical protein
MNLDVTVNVHQAVMVTVKEPLFLSNSQQQKDASAPHHGRPHRTLVSIRHAHVLSPARRGERARVCGMPISFIQLHKRCTERLPHKLDGRLLKYPCTISHFSLALSKWALILSLL